MGDNNGRTHEPSLRELTAQLDGMVKLMEERDRRYDEKFKATEDRTTSALAASEKAITKAEVATEKRFDSVNEMRGSLNDMTSTLLTKAEGNAKFQSIEGKIEEMKKDIIGLRESRSGVMAVTEQKQFDSKTIISVLALIGSFIGIVIGVAALLAKIR